MNSESSRTATAFREPVTTTTEEDRVLFRFLMAAEKRVEFYNSRVPLNARVARSGITWLRGLVGRLNEDGSVS